MSDQATEPRQAFSARVPIPVWEEMERVRVEHYGGGRTALVEDALRKHLFPANGASQQAPVPERVADAVETLEQHAPYRLAKPAAEQGPEAGQPEDSASSPVQAPPRLLVDVVAERTGLPKALARRMVEAGRVGLGGNVCSTPDLNISHAPGLVILLDGSPV